MACGGQDWTKKGKLLVSIYGCLAKRLICSVLVVKSCAMYRSVAFHLYSLVFVENE